MTQPPAVLYDLSTLGQIAFGNANYTGVQRVVHEVARGVAATPGVELQLYGAETLPECVQFASEDEVLKHCTFVNPPSQLRQVPWVRALDAIAQADPQNRSPHRRAKRWAASRLASVLRRRQSVLSDSQLSSFNVYHSPMFAFPEAVLRQRQLAKFLTVYDLTPIKMPEHSHAQILRDYRLMLDSIPKDAWSLCISENTKRDWCEHTGADPTRCFVTPLAAADSFTPCRDAARIVDTRRRYGLPEGDYFLSVSTLEPRKNLPTIIQAFHKFIQETGDKSLSLVLVGGKGWQHEGIFAAAGAAVCSRIHFTGYVAEEDLSALYSGALAFVYLPFYEGFGLPPLEAMQCGTPVITSNNSSLPEVVGSAGLMLDARDQDGLCAEMQRLRSDPELRQQLSRRSLERARLFSWQTCVDRTVAAYRHALAAA